MLIFATYDDFLTAIRDGKCDLDARVSVGSFYHETGFRHLYALPQLGCMTFVTWRAGDVLDCLTLAASDEA